MIAYAVLNSENKYGL